MDDHVLTLQSMSSSKYALKLLDTIKRWEKNLSIVSEAVGSQLLQLAKQVFDAWMVLQRKWMYLESIFLDSEVGRSTSDTLGSLLGHFHAAP